MSNSEQEQSTPQPTDAENQAQPTGAESQAQDDGLDIDDGTEEATEDQGAAAETETPSEQQTQTPEKPINQEAVQKRINKAIRERYEEQRKREEAERKLEEATQKLSAFDQKDITIPEFPDAFDPNFDQKIRARDEALKQQAMQQAQRDLQQRNAEQARMEKAQKQRDQVTGYVNSMFKNAEQMGIKEADLRQADDTVAMFIKDPGLATFILSQKDAPLIINHLAGNIAELETISRMNPIDAAAHIATSVIPAAQKYRPNLPSTPDPIDIPAGKSKGVKQSEYLDGVEFE